MGTITLSFDNGPDPETTPAVLDVLRRRGLAASFFVIGAKLAAPGGRGQAERARAEGHRIGNHTWTHGTPLGLDPDPQAPEREIAATEREIGGLASPERWFRPFGGGGRLGPHLLSPAARDMLLAGGHSCVLWNAVPRDWEDHDGWPARAEAMCAAEPETLLVLHDYAGPAMRHLDRFLGRMQDAGHGFAQEFPASCVPILRGRPTMPLDPFVGTAPG